MRDLKLSAGFTDRWIRGNSKGADYLFWFFIGSFFISIILVEVAAAFYLLIFLLLLFSRRVTWSDPMSILIIAYVLSGLLSFLTSRESNLLVHLTLLCYIPLATGYAGQKNIKVKHWITGIIGFATITAIAGIINHFTGEERTSGFFGGYFTLATLMCWGIPLAAGMFLAEVNKIRWLYLFSILLQTMALWWTFTRSALLGLFIGLGCWVGFYIFRHLRSGDSWNRPVLMKWAILGLVPLLLVILVFTSQDPRMNPLARPPDTMEHNLDFSSGRNSIIRDAISRVTDDWHDQHFLSLVVGYGLSSRQRLIGGGFTSWESDYLQSFMDQGLIGFLLVMGIYFLYSRRILKGLMAENFLLNTLAAAGIVTLVMSIFTLRITGWHSAGVFIINYFLLQRGIRNEAIREASGKQGNKVPE